MDPTHRGPEQYGRDNDGFGDGPGRRRPARDQLTPDPGQPTPPQARVVRLMAGDYLLTVNPVDGSEVELCPPGSSPVRPPAAPRPDAPTVNAPPRRPYRRARPPPTAAPGARAGARTAGAPARPGSLGTAHGTGRIRPYGTAGGRRGRLRGPRTGRSRTAQRLQAHRHRPAVRTLRGRPRLAAAPPRPRRAARKGPGHRRRRRARRPGVRRGRAGGAARRDAGVRLPVRDGPGRRRAHHRLAPRRGLPRGPRRGAAVDLLERAVERPLTDEEANWAGDLWFESEGLPLRFVQAGALLRQRDLLRTDPEAYGVFGGDGKPADAPSDTTRTSTASTSRSPASGRARPPPRCSPHG